MSRSENTGVLSVSRTEDTEDTEVLIIGGDQ